MCFHLHMNGSIQQKSLWEGLDSFSHMIICSEVVDVFSSLIIYHMKHLSFESSRMYRNSTVSIAVAHF